VAPDIRDDVVDFVRDWSDKTEIPILSFIKWLGIARSKIYHWKKRYGKANEHNGKIPRDFWLEDWENKKLFNIILITPMMVIVV